MIVPLVHGVAHHHDHALDAFGSLAIAPPLSRVTAAHAILEECQRMKFGALHNIVPLHSAVQTEERYFAPWTHLPVTLRRVLEGFYSLPAVADLWAVESRVAFGEERTMFELEFARWRSWLDDLAPSLLDCPELTPTGKILIGATRETIDLQLGGEIIALALFSNRDHEICWRVKNLRPVRQIVTELATARASGVQCTYMEPLMLEMVSDPPSIFGYVRKAASWHDEVDPS